MKIQNHLLAIGLFASFFAFAGEHGEQESQQLSRKPALLQRYLAPVENKEEKKSCSPFDPIKYLKDQFTTLPEGTGDFVAVVTDDTCKGDLSAWKSEWGIDKVVGDVKGTLDLASRLRAEGYGPHKKIGTLALSGHGGCDEGACWIKASQGCIGSGMSEEELKSIRELLADDAVIRLMGCNTAKNKAGIQNWANRMGLRFVGNTGVVKSGNSWAVGEWLTFTPEKK